MYFEAELKGKKYKMEVFEAKKYWHVSLQEDGKTKEIHKISKHDYRRMDDAVSFLFNNTSYMIDAVGDGLEYTVYTRGSFRVISLYNDESLLHESLKGGGSLGANDALSAGMPGKIVEILVKPGDVVTAKQPLLIMEAMKMENEMRATHNCTIKEVKVQKGQSVESGAVLIVFESE